MDGRKLMDTNIYYELMHKDIVITALSYNKDIEKVKILPPNSLKYIPIGGQMNMMKLYDWWKDRTVPITRHGLNKLIENVSFEKVQNLMLDNLALSLTDCYWVRPLGSNLCWKDVSMFTHNFCDELGSCLYTSQFSENVRKSTNFMPSSTTQGELKKKWVIDSNGNRILIKGNYGKSYQQSINEVFASYLHFKQGYSNYVNYTLIDVMESSGLMGKGCACLAFTSNDIEFISGWEICQNFKQKSNSNWYPNYRDMCVSLGLEYNYLVLQLDYMILSDFVMSNTDRHFNNLGLLRNSDTLNIFDVAPLFDTGNSMFWNFSYIPIGKSILDLKSHSFVTKEVFGLKNVNNRKVLDITKLPDKKEFYNFYDVECVDVDRLYKAYEVKINYLDEFQHGKDIWKIY